MGYKEVTKIIEENYLKWLKESKLNEDNFIRYRNIANFEIISELEDNFRVIAIGYKNKDNKFVKIGEQIAFPVNDLNALQDMYLLLLLIANKFDDANNKAPLFERRPKYFYNKVKEFIQKQEEYNIIMKKTI